MATRYCINCGQPLDDNARFCTACGVPVPPLQNEPQPEPQQAYEQPRPQPQYGYGAAPQETAQPTRPHPTGPKPSSYLVWAILCTIFCCLPFGIVSIVYAAKVDNLWNAGNYYEAEEASRKARLWLLIGVIIGIVSIVINFIFIRMGASIAGVTFSEFLQQYT